MVNSPTQNGNQNKKLTKIADYAFGTFYGNCQYQVSSASTKQLDTFNIVGKKILK
jgi:hypothetical protein